jgi:hypothetical protein
LAVDPVDGTLNYVIALLLSHIRISGGFDQFCLADSGGFLYQILKIKKNPSGNAARAAEQS